NLNIACVTVDEIKTLKQKKGRVVKNYFKKYDFVIASKELMPQIPKLVGPQLARMSKFPTSVQSSIQDTLNDTHKNIKMAQKKSLCISGKIGNMKMTENELKSNLFVAMSTLVNSLPKGLENIKTIYMCSTMGKSQLLYKK
ncbi:MAG: 60S ribosomal protein L10A, partial [Paramarteilia canceri]